MNTKKILTAFFAGAALVCAMSVNAFAAEAVGTYAELSEPLKNGQDVKLSSNITTDSALNVSGKSVTVDLDKHTLKIGTGDNKFTDGSNITFKNGTININGTVCNGNGIFCIDEYEKEVTTTLTLESVNLVGKDYSSAYGVFYIGPCGVLNINGGTITLENDLAAYDDGSPSGGVFKADSAGATLNIYNGAVLNLTDVDKGVTHCTTTIKDSTVTIKGTDSAKLEHGFNRSALTITNSNIGISGGSGRGITAENGNVTIDGTSTVVIANMNEATIELRGDKSLTIGEYANVSIDQPIKNTTSGSVSGTVTTVNLSGEGTSDAPYLINSLEELKLFTSCVNTGIYNGTYVYVQLTNDIDLKQMDWTPIGTATYAFQGSFDGNGKTISNLYLLGNNDYTGFFGLLGNNPEKPAVVKDLTIDGVTGSNLGSRDDSNGAYAYCGALAGHTYTAKMTNVIVKNAEITANYVTYIGGLVGHGYSTMVNCGFEGNVNANGCTQVGGLQGSCMINATDCYVKGTISGAYPVGGIIGMSQNESGVSIKGCYVEGKVEATATWQILLL